MQLKGKKTKLCIVKVGGTSEEINPYPYKVPLVGVSGDVVTFIAYGIQRISTPIEMINMERVVSLFDDNNIRGVERPTGEVDMLIGFEYAGFHPEKVQAVNHLLLLRNMFGKCLGGSHQCIQESTQKIVKNAVVCFVMNKHKIEDFFHTEELGIDCIPRCGVCKSALAGGKQYTLEEERELATIERGLVLKDRQWTASYPYKRDPAELQNNYKAACAMLISTEKRLLRSEIHAKMYQDQIDDMIQRGVARKLSHEIREYEGPVFYLSHHDVLKSDSQSTPMRIVFNSSARFNNHVLNDFWMKGPDLVNNLVDVLMRFRERECGVTGDIRKMYHTVKICLRDQHVHRFLWRNMKSDQRPDIFVMTAVSFGDRPAAAIATMALQKTAAQRKDEYPEAAQTILENSYVDDIVDSFTSKEHAGIITKNIDRILEDGSFVIKHWRISGEGSTSAEQIVDKDVASERVSKVLGVAWNSFSDKLSLTFLRRKVKFIKTQVVSLQMFHLLFQTTLPKE